MEHLLPPKQAIERINERALSSIRRAHQERDRSLFTWPTDDDLPNSHGQMLPTKIAIVLVEDLFRDFAVPARVAM